MSSSRRDLMDQGRGVNDGSWPDAGVRGPLPANCSRSAPAETARTGRYVK